MPGLSRFGLDAGVGGVFGRRCRSGGAAGGGVFSLRRQRRQGAGVVFGGREEVGAADLQAQRVGRPRVEAAGVGVAARRRSRGSRRASAPAAASTVQAISCLTKRGSSSPETAHSAIADRLALPLLAVVEAVEVFPDRILRVEVGARPVDPAAAGPVVAGEVALHPRRAARQRAPDDAHRRRRQVRRVRPLGAVQRRQADFGQGRVDPFQGLAAADDRDDPAEGLLVPAGRVFAAFLAAVAVDRRPGVEAAVGLAERPDVGGQPVLGEEVVELEEVVVAAAQRDLLRGDHLGQRLVVGGRDVQDRPRAGFAPAFVGGVEAVAPGVEGLQQRRVLADQFGRIR